MILKYIDQSAGKLSYFFFTVPINIKKSFKVACQRQHALGSGKLVVSIIGESHAIQFKNNSIALTEILAHVEDKNFYFASTKSYFVKNLNKRLKYQYKNISFDYRFMLKKEKVNYPQIGKILSGLRGEKKENNLLFEWHDSDLRHETFVPSFTSINYKLCSPGLIRINTRHFYKNELLLITTCSGIRIKREFKKNKTQPE